MSWIYYGNFRVLLRTVYFYFGIRKVCSPFLSRIESTYLRILEVWIWFQLFIMLVVVCEFPAVFLSACLHQDRLSSWTFAHWYPSQFIGVFLPKALFFTVLTSFGPLMKIRCSWECYFVILFNDKPTLALLFLPVFLLVLQRLTPWVIASAGLVFLIAPSVSLLIRFSYYFAICAFLVLRKNFNWRD